MRMPIVNVYNLFCREIVVQTLRSRIRKLATEDKFAVYFCTIPFPAFEQLSFIVDILYATEFPTLFLCYNRGRVKGVCHVPEVSKSGA